MAASKMITVDGVDGFHSAAAIVGKDMATAMLIMQLKIKLNPDHRYPEPDDVPDRIEEILMQNEIL